MTTEHRRATDEARFRKLLDAYFAPQNGSIGRIATLATNARTSAAERMAHGFCASGDRMAECFAKA